MSDPVHILFMNRQGVWDTYTFDRKAIEEKKIDDFVDSGVFDYSLFKPLDFEDVALVSELVK